MLTIEQWITIWIGTASIIPTYVLFKQYLKTHIVDFFLFSGIFLSVTIAAYAIILIDKTNMLIFFQLNHWGLAFTSFFFFVHGTRIRWVKTPKIIWLMGIIWFIVIIVIIAFWELRIEESNAFVLFMEMPYQPNTFHPKGAGLVVGNDVVVYSSSFGFLTNLYLIFVTSILFYSYLHVVPVVQSDRTKWAKRVWMLIWGMILFFSIIRLPWFSQQTTLILQTLVVLAAELIAAALAILVPESMLISHAQIIRAHDLYKRIKDVDLDSSGILFGKVSLVEYLAAIPPELLEHSHLK